MPDHYELVRELTSRALGSTARGELLAEFASGLGWQPSDEFVLSRTASFAPAHLVVEHGLRNTAVLSFVADPGFPGLDSVQRRTLLGLSYNNLVDWHLAIDEYGISYVFNRGKPPAFHEIRERISRADVNPLSSAAFERISRTRPQANIPALDDALIRTISRWKREIGALVEGVSASEISALFNALIFLRAFEDERDRGEIASGARLLARALQQVRLPDNSDVSVVGVIRHALRDCGLSDEAVPGDLAALSRLGEVPADSLAQLLGDLYQNRYAAYYKYDFAVMSRHALSRIYEHYVSLLRPVESEQYALMPPLPEEQFSRGLGQVYTPEFIARFFARYIQEHFRGARRPLKILDPACGSGIFLRTFLEGEIASQASFRDPARPSRRNEASTFMAVTGLDVDPNACNATRLSLALLRLSHGEAPESLGRILQTDALLGLAANGLAPGEFDAIIANPPYVAFERQSEELRGRVAGTLGSAAAKRPDTYLAFLALSLEALRPGGLGLFVLPQTFLMSESAAPVRAMLAEQAWIRAVADLSVVPVFEKTGVYPVLIVFEKRRPNAQAPTAILARCRENVGQALGHVLSGVPSETADYEVFEAEQEMFERATWVVLPPAEDKVVRALQSLPRIEQFLDIHQGMITGADDVYIISRGEVPTDGEEFFRPFLSDREIDPYSVPDETSERIFVPYFRDGGRLSSEILMERFPTTFAYLEAHRDKLEARSPVSSGSVEWWRPTRPRNPNKVFVPKIVTPHLVLLPQFAMDGDGKYGVSRSPYMIPKSGSPESEIENLLKYFTAVLNSSAAFWHINGHARRYGGKGSGTNKERRGYAMLEVRELKGTPVPDPGDVPPAKMRALLELVDRRIDCKDAQFAAIEHEIDQRVADLYRLSSEERRSIGVGL